MGNRTVKENISVSWIYHWKQ